VSYQQLVPAQLAFNSAGVSYAPAFDDIYHSDSGGLDQARHVFIAGNDLPNAWQGREQFTILETGFGLGLNFLATWQAWRDDQNHGAQHCTRLHFVSVEKHPFARTDLAQLHSRWPELATLANELQSQWPVLTPGVHRLLLDNGRVTLTLLFGDAVTHLRKLVVQADALYLDGFAPTKNPELWDKPFLKALTRLCKPGATLATWTVAATVREALTAQRWTLEKRPGFGSKRDMLCGRLYGYVRPEPFDNAQDRPVEDQTQTALGLSPSTSSGRTAIKQHAIVIGAGIAGTAIAERLAARQWHVDLIERHPAVASEASGNPVGLLHPMLAKDDNLAARLSRAGYLYTLRLLAKLATENLGLCWNQCGILQLARDAAQENAQRETTDALCFPDDYITFDDHSTAAQRAGHAVTAGGWYYPAGAIVNPPSLCNALLMRHRQAITMHFNTEITQLCRDGENWLALDQHGRTIAAAPILIVANAFDAARLISQCNLPLSRLRGQITQLPTGSLPCLRHALCGNGYVTPDTLGAHSTGATFDMDDDDPLPREDGHRFNLQRLAELMPGVDTSKFESPQHINQLEGRVGFRTMAIDRMPIVGALPDTEKTLKPGAQLRDVPRLPNLYSLLALGSRGLAWGPLMAELLAAQLNHEPLPLERDLIAAIDPGRFLIRRQRRTMVTSTVPIAQDL
jgi:tRNA 5-methylaminomethyl-2-thiouridine biosynthesis bifunctional protein